jgi:hypothetical protein
MTMYAAISKSPLTSKTFWFNVIGGIVMILEALQAFDFGESGTQILGTALVVGNILIRFLTQKPMTLKGGKEVIVKK